MPRSRRRYLVAEVVSSMSWSGIYWSVGCTSRDRAILAFERRVAKNFLDEGEMGAVMLYDRLARQLICWTDRVTDPAAAARWWFRGADAA